MNIRVFCVTVAVTLVSASAGYGVYRVQQTPPEPAFPSTVRTQPRDVPELETRIGDWSFADLSGERQALETWAGKVMVVNFWATWCPPCMREIPAFMALQERYGDRGVQFIGIAMDEAENVAMFAEAHGVNYPLLVGDDDVMAFMRSLGNELVGLPYTAVIDRDGSLRLVHQGEWSEQDAETALESVL